MKFITSAKAHTRILQTMFAALLLLGFSQTVFAQTPPYNWLNRAGGSDDDQGYGVATDANGNVYATGMFLSSSITFGSTLPLINTSAQNDIYLVKYNSSGVVRWAELVGGALTERSYGVATDGAGNVFLTGTFTSATLTLGSTTLTNSNPGGGYSDIFLAKFDTSGNVLWAKSATGVTGNKGGEIAYGVATDLAGNVIITGIFRGATLDFDGITTLNNANPTIPSGGQSDVFIAKYDNDGNFIWANSAGGTSNDIAISVAADANGDAIITGYFTSTDISFDGGSTTQGTTGANDIFVAKYDGTTGSVIWGNKYGGTGNDLANGVTADASSNVFVTGYFASANVTFGSTTLTLTGSNDLFLAKLNASGTTVWAKSAGTSGALTSGWDAVTDASGNVYLNGSYSGSSIAFGSATLTNTDNTGTTDIFTVKYDASGNALWALGGGGTGNETPDEIAIDASGKILIVGSFYSPSITFGTNTQLNNNATFNDMFVAQIGTVAACTAPNGTVAFGAFTGVTTSATTTNVTYTNGGNSATGYALLRSTTNTAPTAPTSGTAVPAAGSTTFVSGYTVVNTTTTLGSSVAFNSTGLNPSTTYYYWVVAYQSTNGPCWFTPATQAANSQATTTPACTAPNGTVAFGAFTGVTTSATTTNVTYTNGGNPATGYALLRSTTNTAPTAPASGTAVPAAGSTTFVSGYTVVNTTTTLGSSVAFNSTGLNPSTTYYYWVVAYQSTNGPCWFTPATQAANSQATLAPACTAPNGTVAFGSFTGVTTSATTTNVTYTNGGNPATGYALLRSTTNTAPTAPASGTAVPAAGSTTFVSGYTVVNTTTTLGSSVAFNSTGLNPSTTYYYWVVAYQSTNGPCWFTPATQSANSQATLAPVSATALNLDGADDQVNISNSTVFNMSSGTIEAWFKTSNAGAGYRAIVVKEFFYGIFLLNNQVHVFNWSGGANFTSAGTYNDGNWHHVAFVFNNGVANGSKVFIDGVAQTPFTYNAGTPSTTTLCIGNSPGNPQNFNGTIDEVRIWNKALCDGAIINQRNCELGGTLSSDLLAYYKFNQGTDAGNNTSILSLTDAKSTYPGTFSGLALTGSTSNFILGGSTPTGTTCTYVPLTATASNTGPYCEGTTINLSSVASGGNNASYSYSWASSAGGAYTATGNPATRPTATAAMTGAHNVTVTDASACTATATTSVTVNASPNAPTVGTITQPTCVLATGSVVLNDLPAGNWTINPGAITGSTTSRTITGLTANTYNYTVTNSLGCISAQSANIVINAQPATPSIPTVTIASASCSAAGAATISNYNGSLTYTFTPAGPTAGAGGAISSLTPGTNYTVTAGNGTCTSASSAQFSVAAQLTVPSTPTVSTTAASCSAAGTATISNYNGLLTYTFTPTGPTAGAGGAISSVVAGTNYTVTAGNGSCASTASSSFNIAAQLTVPAVPTITTTAASCLAAGTATISNYNGSLTYTFTPTGPTAGAGGVISSLVAGTNYTVTAGNGTCTSASSAQFSVAAQFTVPSTPTITTTAASCSAAGTATITNYSGSLTYTFTPTGPTAGAGGAISALVAGTNYTVTAGNGSCASTASSSFNIAAQLTVPSTPTVSTTAASCSAAGTATISNYNGSLTYAFTPTGPTAGAGGAISSLTPGTNYTVTAGNGTCTSASSAQFSVAAQLTVPSTPTITTTAASCSAAGTATITNYSGSLTYTFTPTGPTAGAGGAISALVAGTNYTVTAGNGSCASTASSSFNIAAQLTVPAVPTITTTAASCLAAGTATISNYNGSLTYAFTPTGPTAGAGGAISSLTPGTNYTVTAGNGTCTSASSAQFSVAAQLTVPSTPTITTTAASCSAAGTATITNYSSSLTYTFTPTGPTAGAGGVISSMTPGTNYTVTAGNGSCASASSAQFSVAAQLTVPAVPTITTTAASCSAAGTATISNYNGSLTYAFTPTGPTAGAGGAISSLTPGTNYTVTAGNGTCTSASSAQFSVAAQLTPPAPPTITTLAANYTRCLFSALNPLTPTSITLNAGTYTNASYQWANVTDIANPVNLGTAQTQAVTTTFFNGKYEVTVTITGGNGCTSSATAQTELIPTFTPIVPNPVTYSSPPPACGGNAVLSVTPGGLSNYKWFDYSNNDFSTPISGATSNTYTVTTTGPSSYAVSATDANGCIAASFTAASVTLYAAVTATATSSPACAGSPLTLTGGASGYATYAWSGPNSYTVANNQNPTVSNSATTAESGTYTLTVTSNDNCTATASTAVTVSAVSVGGTATAVQSDICLNGTAQLSLTGNNGDVLRWESNFDGNGWNALAQSNLANFTTNMLNPEGTYQFRAVVQSGSCAEATSFDEVVIVYTPQITGTLAVCESGSTTTLTGSTLPSLTNPWVSSNLANATINSQTGVVTGVAAGNATITYTDINGCKGTATITVNANPTAPVVDNVTQPTCRTSTGNVALSGLPAGSWIINPGAITGSTGSTTITGLAAGTYNYTVINLSGCTSAVPATAVINPVVTPANVLYVDSAIATPGNGATWATAYKELSEALKTAHECTNVTQVLVAKGTYQPAYKPFNNGIEISTNDARDVTFHLRSNLAVYGGYDAATGTRNIAANPTILSGDIGTANNNTDNTYHVVLIANANGTDKNTLDGFNLTGGNANGNGIFYLGSAPLAQSIGGGIYIKEGTNNISNNTISGNTAQSHGGGILTNSFANNSTCTISNNTISGNTAQTFGGGVSIFYGLNILSNNTISGNIAQTDGGGGIFTFSSTNTISNNIFWGNKSGTSSSTQQADYKNDRAYLASNTFKNNLLQLADNNYTAGNSNALGTASGNLFAVDPQFVDPTNPNLDAGLQLQGISPCINAGASGNGIPTTDKLGNLRTGNPDLGAYEFTGTPCPVAITTTPANTTEINCTNTSIGLTATGGGTYQWNAAGGSATTDTITATAAGSYEVTVTGANGCLAVAAIQITSTNPVINTAGPASQSSAVLDPSWPQPDGVVYAIVRDGNTVYVGGNFSTMGGQTRNNIAAIDATTHLVLDYWAPNANGRVFSLAVSGNNVYVGGLFSAIGGQQRNSIAALDARTGGATDWNPDANNTVYALAVSGNTVYAGGSFTSIGGQQRSKIAALDAVTSNATAWNPAANDDVRALAISGNIVYVGGEFSNVGGQGRNFIAAIDATTGNATTWNPSADAFVYALALSGSTVYAGGRFNSIGGQLRNYIAAIDATTGNATTWEPNANSTVTALAVAGNKVYGGGFFTNIGGQTRKSIAALDASTGNATAWNPDANLVVRALAVSGSTVYAGGDFYNIAGQPRKHFAVINNASDFCVNAIAPGTQYTTTGATGIGTAINLPPGLTAVWAANTLTISGKPTQTGTYDYSIPLTGGCGTVNTTGAITVKAEAPTIELAPTITVCEGSYIKIQPKYSYEATVNADDIPGLTYQWSVPGTPDLTNTSVYESTVTTTGLYKLTVSAQGACEASAETNVSFVPAFDLAIVPGNNFDLTPQFGDAVTLNSQLTGAAGAVTYLWAAPGNFNIPDKTAQNISFVYNSKEAQNISLTASIGGCEKTAQITINVYLTINAVFSPDGDGINDNLQVTTSLDLTNAQWCILKDNLDVACGLGPLNWDGKRYNDNTDCPAGEYIAVIWVNGKKEDFDNGKRNQYTRTITLIR